MSTAGVYAPRAWPNGSALPSNDPGCPTGCLFDLIADPTESRDLAATTEGKAVLAQLIARQQAIGLTVHQTNFSDVDDPSDCITLPQMLAKYDGFLGPRCGVSP